MIVSHLIEVVLIAALGLLLRWENQKRDRIQSQMEGGLEGRDLDATAFLDLTDRENLKYVCFILFCSVGLGWVLMGDAVFGIFIDRVFMLDECYELMMPMILPITNTPYITRNKRENDSYMCNNYTFTRSRRSTESMLDHRLCVR